MGEMREQVIKSLIGLLNSDNPDSLEFGSASKGGAVKVYGNFEKPEEFQKKLDNAFSMRAYAQSKERGEKDAGAFV